MNLFRSAPASTAATVLLTAFVGVGVFNAQSGASSSPVPSSASVVAMVQTDALYLPAQFVEQQRAAPVLPLPAQF